MSEGPEVRILVDQLQGGIGRRLVNIRFMSGRYRNLGVPDGFADFAATMTKHIFTPEPIDIIKEINCKGKFIYMVLDDGKRDSQDTPDEDFQRSLFITLGMTGHFFSEKEIGSRSANRWYFEMLNVQSGKTSRIYYQDPKDYGTLKLCLSLSQLQSKLATLGPDILDAKSTTVQVFLDKVDEQKPELNVCKFLMDQKKISGVGNYLLAEGLYKSDTDPYASLGELDDRQRRALFQSLQSTALASYETQSRGESFPLLCYGKQFCPRGDRVIHDTEGPHGRSIWYTNHQLSMSRQDRATAVFDFGGNESRKKVAKSETVNHEDTVVEKSQVQAADVAGASEQETSSATSNHLVQYLTDPSWKKMLSDDVETDGFLSLMTFLEEREKRGATVYPPQQDVFSALNLCPYDKVKVVIVGQDPYHGPGQGHGLAFSVRVGVPLPPTLQNIFKVAQSDVGIDPPPHGNLEAWAQQGVLLLNSVLTVEKGVPNSHAKKGWEEFTDAIISHLDEQSGRRLVFMLWGAAASKKARKVDRQRHFVIESSHPSPLGAGKTKQPFLESRCFARCNSFLEGEGDQQIDWSVPPQ